MLMEAKTAKKWNCFLFTYVQISNQNRCATFESVCAYMCDIISKRGPGVTLCKKTKYAVCWQMSVCLWMIIIITIVVHIIHVITVLKTDFFNRQKNQSSVDWQKCCINSNMLHNLSWQFVSLPAFSGFLSHVIRFSLHTAFCHLISLWWAKLEPQEVYVSQQPL